MFYSPLFVFLLGLMGDQKKVIFIVKVMIFQFNVMLCMKMWTF